MAWPPSTGNPQYFYEEGITTVVWGTDGLLTGHIVKSMRSTTDAEKIYIENGVGLRAVRIRLIHGKSYELTIVEDTTFVPPTPGETLAIYDPGGRLQATMSVDSDDTACSRKAEGERTIRGVIDNLID
jgi:hypothetical protein